MLTSRFVWSFLIALSLTSAVANGQAQYQLLYSFGTNASDGSMPNGGLVFDKQGNMYGTTQQGGAGVNCEFCGTVFELSPSNGGWTETVIYSFCSLPKCADGEEPAAGLIFDSLGNLYGTTVQGGTNQLGAVFELSPPKAPGSSWTEKALWSFVGAFTGDDGAWPYSRLNWDASGNLYGTASLGGISGGGTVFKVSPDGDGTWTETTLYSFCPDDILLHHCPDGFRPVTGVTFDKAGNLYGTASAGGFADKWGVLYKLSPPPSGDDWTETTLYKFVGTGGGQPLSVVSFDESGNAYATASTGAPNSPGLCGGVFKFIPSSGKKLSYLFYPNETGCRPQAGVLHDERTGTLYVTTEFGGFSEGNVYAIKGGTASVLYTFCSQDKCTDGAHPTGSLTADRGRLFSTTTQGGAFNKGIVFVIRP
ncbi:MAG: choice-of-anchor tandem repeat GloVer-containing protein [Terriglobales bacterium]